MTKGIKDLPRIDNPRRPRALTNTQVRNSNYLSNQNGTKAGHGRAASEVSTSMSRDSRTLEALSSSLETPVTQSSETLNENKPPLKSLNDFTWSERFPQSDPSSVSNNVEALSNRRERTLQGSNNLKRTSSFSLRPHQESSLGITDMSLRVNSITEDHQDHLLPLGNTSDAGEVQLSGNQEVQIHDSGVSFEDLVDRLLVQPKSKLDSKFSIVFLCLYRKFAAPSTLITAIIRHFEELNDKEIQLGDRLTTQLGYLQVLKDWVSDYPGDFAHPLSRRIVNEFVHSLAVSEAYKATIKDISPHLEVVCEDDDTEWACSDKTRSRANTMESFLTMSSGQSAASTLNADSPTLTADSSTEDIVDNIDPREAEISKASRVSATLSSNSSISRSDSQSTGSFQTLLNNVESAQRQAQLLTPISRNMLTKVQWHQLMQIPEDHIARELTRIDWIMYSSIRPRDLIRHVSLQANQKEKCKSLEYVNRMIHQFNHVAFWVTNMILLRDKSKHRAKALEKFMMVAWKLRNLNNYNSLGAVIAGINGTAVHRLSQTRELIPPEAQKQFMRLEILMGTQKSHFAYRLAFGNTSTSRIPFLPLHRRDLVLAEQGNKTFVSDVEGDRINWKKFEIMGEVILSIRESQNVGYPQLNGNEEVQRLVLEGRFCKDDDVSLFDTKSLSSSRKIVTMLGYSVRYDIENMTCLQRLLLCANPFRASLREQVLVTNVLP